MTIVIHIHCIISRNDIIKFFFWQKNILWFWQTWSCWNDLVLLSGTALLWISHTLWMWPQKQKHINNPGKKRGGGEGTKTLAMMMGAHPVLSARESISLFWTFNRCCRFKPFSGFDRAVHVIQSNRPALLWIS